MDWFTLNYPKFLGFITELTNVVFTLLKTLFNTIFIPIILFGVIFVEIPRVQSGIAIFDPNPQHAVIGATVVVFVLLVLEFLTLYLEQNEGYNPETSYKFSLRLLYERFKYFLGYSKDFQPELRSPAQRYKNVASLVRNGIIFLSVIGTMQFVIQEASINDVPWYEALINVFYQSNLQTITNWLVGLIFALIIVRSSTVLTNYIGVVAFNAVREIQSRQSILLKKQKERMTPDDFFEVFRSRKLRELAYHQNDYFTYVNNKARFFDGIRGKMSTEEFSIPEDRIKFITYVEKIIRDR